MIYNYSGIELYQIYDYDENAIHSAYNSAGDIVFSSQHVPNVVFNDVYNTLSPAPSPVTQGGAYYNGNLVVAQASGQNQATLAVYDVSTGVKIGGTNLSNTSTTYHGNTLCFDDALHSGNNQYPYLYISEYYGDGIIGVFDLANNDSEFSASEVQTINFSTVSSNLIGAGYHDFMIDHNANILYVVRYKTAGTYAAEEGNTTIITAFELPNIANSSVVLSDADIIACHEISSLIYARQECVYHDGYAYILAGTSTARKGLYIIDCTTFELYTVIQLGSIIDGEPEALYFYDDYLYIVDNTKIYKFTY